MKMFRLRIAISYLVRFNICSAMTCVFVICCASAVPVTLSSSSEAARLVLSVLWVSSLGPQITRLRLGRWDHSALQPVSLSAFLHPFKSNPPPNCETLSPSTSEMTPNTSAIESPLPLLKRSDRIARERGVKWQQWPETLYQQDNSDAETLNCSHPDLEDGSLIAWGLQQSSHSTGEGVEIDVLYGNGTDLCKD